MRRGVSSCTSRRLNAPVHKPMHSCTSLGCRLVHKTTRLNARPATAYTATQFPGMLPLIAALSPIIFACATRRRSAAPGACQRASRRAFG